MSTSLKQFYIELYLEHLEEASFLYDQRRALFHNPEIPWPRIGEFEERFEAHIDALVVGGDLALDVCRKQAAEGDAGELHAAVRVFCRQDRKDLFHKALEAVDPADADKARALGDALAHELPVSWQPDLLAMLKAGDAGRIPWIARAAGFGRLKDFDLVPALSKVPVEGLHILFWALGRLGDASACAALHQNGLKHEDPGVRKAAALALLRLHDLQITQHCLKRAHQENWALLPLALGGGRFAGQVALDALGASKPTDEGLLAVGIAGDPAAVEPLLEHLGNPESAAASALALHLITGADLQETVVVPEPVDEDELFDEEREKLKKGEPLPGPGGRAGTEVTRLSQDPLVWQKWWTANHGRFRKVRHRLGKPFTPACLVEQLENEMTPHRLRGLAYDELIIRYKIDVPFETDFLATKQQAALAEMRRWLQASANRFQEGAWCFAGQVCAGGPA
jgi:uncharacterized protein (TIGR02270 family)